VATVGAAAVLPRGGAGDGVAAKDDYWIVFDEQAIPARVAKGEVIFVDVTADWCITCKANKALVLSRGEVAKKLGGGTVVAMRADWTRPDPAISRYLAKYGRYGIPFNVVYGPGAPQGIALPELLTSDTVLAALDQAGVGAPKAVATKP
jgi:suppressor for copper-sensitivity B